MSVPAQAASIADAQSGHQRDDEKENQDALRHMALHRREPLFLVIDDIVQRIYEQPGSDLSIILSHSADGI